MQDEQKNVNDRIETRLAKTAAQLLEVGIDYARAVADGSGSAVVGELCSRDDLTPRLMIQSADFEGTAVTVSVWLHDRATGRPVARLFEIAAAAVSAPHLH